jgi:hypothetical protein
VRGFVIGFSLRGGLHAVSGVVQTVRGKGPVAGRAHALDTLRWATAVATFASVYVIVDESLREYFSVSRCVTQAI